MSTIYEREDEIPEIFLFFISTGLELKKNIYICPIQRI